jgi:hypothetical protein
MRTLMLVLIVAAAACGAPVSGAPSASPPRPTPGPAVPIPTRVSRDSTSASLVPPGYGTLRQEDVAIVLQPDGVRVSAIPLDESVIRTLAPDTYRVLRATIESKRQQIMQRAALRGIRDPRVWYVTFTGLTPDARFVPTDFTVTSGGREYRPVDVIGLTTGFSEQRLQPRETQRGLLVFDESLDVSQPVTVIMGSERNTDWSNDRSDSILSRIESERAQIRARASARP